MRCDGTHGSMELLDRDGREFFHSRLSGARVCYTQNFFKRQRIKLPEMCSCQARVAGAHVCGCPSSDTTRWSFYSLCYARWVCPREAGLLHIYLIKSFHKGLSCTLFTLLPSLVTHDNRKVHSSLLGYLNLLFGNVYILHYLHHPTTLTVPGDRVPFISLSCFYIQCLIGISYMNVEWRICWVKNE